MTADSFDFPAHIETYLVDHNVLNLCTADENGPWGAAVFYAHNGLKFWFMSDPTTRHGSKIIAEPTTAATIHEDYPDWQHIRGLQMSGRSWLVENEYELKNGMRSYLRKYSFAEAFLDGSTQDTRSKVEGVRLYCFEPDLVWWLDNSRAFGHRIRVYPPDGR